MVVNGNAIRTRVKCPLKRSVRISEVQNSGVPLYSIHILKSTKASAFSILIEDTCTMGMTIYVGDIEK